MLLLLLLTIEACTAKDTVPVFIMDHGKAMSYRSIEPDPLKKIATKTFSSIAKEAMQKAECVIIFLEEHLCTEDITTKDKKGSPYTNLQLELLKKNVKYLPAVEHPYKTLTRFFKPMPFNVFHLTPGAQLKPQKNYFKFIYVIFKDIKQNETRTESLRKHDTLIKEVYSTVKVTKRVVAIYTGKVNPVVVEKLQYVPARPMQTPETKSVLVASEGALFRFSGVHASNSKRRSNFNLIPMVSSETFSRRKLSTTMTYAEFDLQFNFGFGDSEWMLDSVVLLEGGEEVGRRLMQVGAPWNWSYTCGEPLCIINDRDGSVITVSQYQIQPMYSNIQRRSLTLYGDDEVTSIGEELRDFRVPYIMSKNKRYSNSNIYHSNYRRQNEEFGQTVNCGPYFSISILSGLFVVYTCLGVLGYAILMMFSCGGNDRYDDPHGKEVFTVHGDEK